MNPPSKREVYLLTESNGFFGQRLMPWESMDVGVLVRILSEHFCVVPMTYAEIANSAVCPKNSIVVHSSSQQPEYKNFIDDLLLYLHSNGNRVVPSIHATRSHENKGYQELHRRLRGIESPKASYAVCIALIIVLNYASALAPGFAGKPFVFSFKQFAAHLGYVNSFLGYGWYNPVFWTLAIEFQWYLFVALIYPLVASVNPARRWLVWTAFAWLPHSIDSQVTLFYFLPLFAVGVATFQFWTKLISRREYFVVLALFGVLNGIIMGVPVGVAAVLAALAICYWNLKSRWLLAAGTVSYSLYLVHVPIGGRVINLSRHLPQSLPMALLALTAALASSLAAAYLLWRFIEKPSLGMARKLSLFKSVGLRNRPPSPENTANTTLAG